MNKNVLTTPNAPPSDTIVIQTFRNTNIPNWIQRCLDSVRSWAATRGYDYSLAGDEFYELCGTEYLERGSKNPQALTNLARLVASRQRLDAGYKTVIWLDADIFVFDPQGFVFDFPPESLLAGYAFGREVWLERDLNGVLHHSPPVAHNAAMFFTQGAVDLDVLISLIRHIDAKREIISNYQVGVRLLRGLQYSLMFPTFSHVGVFSPDIIKALASQNNDVLQRYGNAYRYQSFACNLGLSLQDRISGDVLTCAMDLLEEGKGEAINKHATHAYPQLVPYDG